MNEDKEKISAWLDDAVEYNEMNSLKPDQDAQAFSTVTRYQIIGDALRGNVTDASMIDISAKVREAIKREPELAPATGPASTTRRPSHSKAKPLFDFGSWLRPVGGLAVAATVAMVMVVTLTDQQAGTDNAVVADVGQQPVQALPVSNPAPQYTNPRVAMPAINLNSYVTKHSEYAAQDTLQGMMPYARAVSYGAENKPSVNNTVTNAQIVNKPGK